MPNATCLSFCNTPQLPCRVHTRIQAYLISHQLYLSATKTQQQTCILTRDIFWSIVLATCIFFFRRWFRSGSALPYFAHKFHTPHSEGKNDPAFDVQRGSEMKSRENLCLLSKERQEKKRPRTEMTCWEPSKVGNSSLSLSDFIINVYIVLSFFHVLACSWMDGNLVIRFFFFVFLPLSWPIIFLL